MNKTWQLVLILIGIFAAGAVSGGFVTVRYARALVQHNIAERFVMQQMKQFADQLQLTRQQRDRIRPILMKTGEQLRDLQRDRLSTLDQMDDDVKKELSDGQRVKYEEIREQLNNENREKTRRMQRWLKDQHPEPMGTPAESPTKP